jgi:hypothetical protein
MFSFSIFEQSTKAKFEGGDALTSLMMYFSLGGARVCEVLRSFSVFNPELLRAEVVTFSATDERKKLGWPDIDAKNASSPGPGKRSNRCQPSKKEHIRDWSTVPFVFCAHWTAAGCGADEIENVRKLYEFQLLCMRDAPVVLDLSTTAICCVNYMARIALEGDNASIIRKIVDQILINRRHYATKTLNNAYECKWLDRHYYALCGADVSAEKFEQRRDIVTHVCKSLVLGDDILAVLYKRYLRRLSDAMADLRAAGLPPDRRLAAEWEKTLQRLKTSIGRGVKINHADFSPRAREFREAYVMAGRHLTRLRFWSHADACESRDLLLCAIIVDNDKAFGTPLMSEIRVTDLELCVRYGARACLEFMMEMSFPANSVARLLFECRDQKVVERYAPHLKTDWAEVVACARFYHLATQQLSAKGEIPHDVRISAAGAVVLINKYPIDHFILYEDTQLFGHLPVWFLYRNTSDSKLVTLVSRRSGGDSLKIFTSGLSRLRAIISLPDVLADIVLTYLWSYIPGVTDGDSTRDHTDTNGQGLSGPLCPIQ